MVELDAAGQELELGLEQLELQTDWTQLLAQQELGVGESQAVARRQGLRRRRHLPHPRRILTRAGQRVVRRVLVGHAGLLERRER